jgi:hypothetical protein
MVIKYQKYTIIHKGYPIEFLQADNYLTNDIESADLYDNEAKAHTIFDELDESNNFDVIPINITYEI